MWNVILYSYYSGDRLFPLKGFDGRPLRFTEKRYADRTAYELNSRIFNDPTSDSLYEDGIVYAVFEDDGTTIDYNVALSNSKGVKTAKRNKIASEERKYATGYYCVYD